MSAIAKIPEETMTLEAYLDWEAAAHTKHEFFDGKVVEMPGGTFEHNLIAANVLEVLKKLLRNQAKQYYVLGSDMKIYLPDFNHAVYPDTVVICESPQFYQNRRDVITNPKVIVEVLSDSTEKYDRGEKFIKYQTLPSFEEYILISQNKPFVTTWYAEADDLWRFGNYRRLEDHIVLHSVSIEIPMEAVFEGVTFSEE